MQLGFAVQCIAAAALVHRAAAFRSRVPGLRSASRVARPPSAMSDDDAAQKLMQEKFMEHQKGAAKLSCAVQSRSIVAYSAGYAVLSTNSKADNGYPAGAVVGFAPGEDGLPLFFLSSISGHTRDLLASPKASLTVTSGNFDGADSGRVNLLGDIQKLTQPDEVAAARERFLKTHPEAYWIDFGDFAAFRMTEVRAIRFVGGFAGAANIAPLEYLSVAPDPILAFSTPVAKHMNDDHSETTVAMVRHYVGLDAESAFITSVDSLGMQVRVTRTNGESLKLRLPFPRPAAGRKEVKDLIVEMTRASTKC
ncbi:hypothetical protein T492DRAFT_942572 [Pavlovales sp. CCMP2436]|nr:hypothetical protein T492DRAFT_942572 [Pavlovales sp. CCMP2436]